MDESSLRFVGEGLQIRRGHLPHWQLGSGTYFVTFRSARGPLPERALALVKAQVIDGQGARYDLVFGVLMPDHVHLMLRPRERELGRWWDLAVIMKGIKGGSARLINQALGTQGTVWQKESFDRLVRDEEEFQQNWQYMYFNPRKAGLVVDPEDYPWFIRAACPLDQSDHKT
jgi:putative transposase